MPPNAAPAPDDPRDSARPRWVRPALLALLAATAVLYLWGLGSSGWANDYYAAAAQAGTQDWKAWLFGSLDSGNAITVDKPPAALWVMALSGRLFGFSALTMLLPQALMGVASACCMRRCADQRTGGGPDRRCCAGRDAGGRADVPVQQSRRAAGAVAGGRGLSDGARHRDGEHPADGLVGCVLGFAFLTKMLQAFLVVPGLALAFLVAAPVGLWQRLGKLGSAGSRWW